MITLDIDKKLHGATSTAPTSVSTCNTKLPTIAYHSTALCLYILALLLDPSICHAFSIPTCET